jgi:hypothetical protein
MFRSDLYSSSKDDFSLKCQFEDKRKNSSRPGLFPRLVKLMWLPVGLTRLYWPKRSLSTFRNASQAARHDRGGKKEDSISHLSSRGKKETFSSSPFLELTLHGSCGQAVCLLFCARLRVDCWRKKERFTKAEERRNRKGIYTQKSESLFYLYKRASFPS